MIAAETLAGTDAALLAFALIVAAWAAIATVAARSNSFEVQRLKFELNDKKERLARSQHESLNMKTTIDSVQRLFEEERKLRPAPLPPPDHLVRKW